MDYFNPRSQYTLYLNPSVDIICIPAHQVRIVHQSAQHQVFTRTFDHTDGRPETNWLLW